jgi:hypothetical protein
VKQRDDQLARSVHPQDTEVMMRRHIVGNRACAASKSSSSHAGWLVLRAYAPVELMGRHKTTLHALVGIIFTQIPPDLAGKFDILSH